MKYNAPVTTMRAEIDQKGFARILQDVQSSCNILQDSKHFAGFYKIAILLQDSWKTTQDKHLVSTRGV